MKLYFDRRLGYLVTAPGQDSPLTELTGKRGDGQEVQIQFGRSSDPTSSSVILSAPVWTAEQLAGGSVITIGIKLAGEYGDGTLLAGTSTFTYDGTDQVYEGTLDLNTEALTDALLADDANAANDLDSLDCGFEVTYQPGGSGPWSTSLNEITYTVLNDILTGDEGTPVGADTPTEYPLKTEVILYYKTVTSLTGGTAADLDYVPTVSLAVDTIIGFYDQDPATDVVRFYKLAAGTDAESTPDVIRPDDYNASTNAKVWKLLPLASTGINAVVDDTTPQFGGNLDANGFNLDFDDNTGIRDDSGNEQLTFQKTASAVNQFEITNAATGSGPTLSAAGGDTNIDINLTPKGTGVVKAGGTALVVNPMTTTGDIIKAGASGAPSRLAIGSSGHVLTVSGGAPVWAAAPTTAPVPIADNAKTAGFSLALADLGDIFSIDTSSGNVQCLIVTAATGGWGSSMYFWAHHRYSGNTATVMPDTGVLLNDGSSAVTLTAGKVYQFWQRSADDWLVLSQS